jgi:hypothetical protein
MFENVRLVSSYPGNDIGEKLNHCYQDLPSLFFQGYGDARVGVCLLPLGISTLTTPFVNTSPFMAVQGQGPGATTILCSVDSDCLTDASQPFNGLTNPVAQAAEWKGFTLIGNPGTKASGIHVVDMVGRKYSDIVISGFPNGPCLWMENKKGWTERVTLNGIYLLQCVSLWRFTGSVGQRSFGYMRALDLRMNLRGSETAFDLGKYADVYHGSFTLILNKNPGPATIVKLDPGATMDDNVWTATAEDTAGDSLGVLYEIPTGARFSGTGVINAYGNWKSVLQGQFNWHLGTATLSGKPLLLTTPPNTYIGATAGNADTQGTWLIGPSGQAGHYLMGLGINLYFDGKKWICRSDGANSGCFGILANSGEAQLGVYAIPTAGNRSQSLSPDDLRSFRVFTFRPDGTRQSGTEGIGVSPAACSLSINPVAVPPNTCAEQRFSAPQCSSIAPSSYMNFAHPDAALVVVKNWRMVSATVIGLEYCNFTSQSQLPSSNTVSLTNAGNSK